jgi:hypothetical protein
VSIIDRIRKQFPASESQLRRFIFVELAELRQRLLLRSKSADIPPIANPVQISDVALIQAASKLKWEPALSVVEIAAKLGISATNVEPAAVKVESAPAASASSAKVEPVSIPPAPIAMLNNVDQLSEQTTAFRELFDSLGRQMEQIEGTALSADQAYQRIAGVFEHLSALATNFQSVKVFAEQVKTLLPSLEPTNALNTQLEQVTEALRANVKEIGVALAPVKNFQSKVRQLMSALDSIEKLEGQIAGLAEAFQPASTKSSETPQAQGASKPQKAAAVAQAA